jgi:hypothetical protein
MHYTAIVSTSMFITASVSKQRTGGNSNLE